MTSLDTWPQVAQNGCMDTKEKQSAVRMESGDYRKLERIAKELDRSVAWVMRDAIRQYIANHKSPKS